MSRKRENTNTAFRTVDQLITAGDSFPCGVTLRNTVLEFAEKMAALSASTFEMYRLRYKNKTVDFGFPLWGVDCSEYLNSAEWFVSPDGHLYYYTDEHCSLDENQREFIEEFCECECERNVDCENCAISAAYYYNLVRVDTWEALTAAVVDLSTDHEELGEDGLYDLLINTMNGCLDNAARNYHWHHKPVVLDEVA